MLTLRNIKRVMIAIAGFTVILIGVVMIVTPGPAIIVIPAGLSILAIEFAWARRWLAKTREYIEKAKTGAANTPGAGHARRWMAAVRDSMRKFASRFSRKSKAQPGRPLKENSKKASRSKAAPVDSSTP